MIGDFYILDFSYDIEEGKPVIYIWAIDKDNNRVLILEKNFRPYFYALLEDNNQKIIDEVKKLNKSESPITKLDVLDKKYYGNPVKALRIETVIPAYVRTYREAVAKISGIKEVLEADIRFYMRYSIDSGLRPFFWFQADVEEINDNRFRVSRVYNLKKVIKIYEDNPPELRVISFDIEVYNKYGFPDPKRDPVIIIGVGLRMAVSNLLMNLVTI